MRFLLLLVAALALACIGSDPEILSDSLVSNGQIVLVAIDPLTCSVKEEIGSRLSSIVLPPNWELRTSLVGVIVSDTVALSTLAAEFGLSPSTRMISRKSARRLLGMEPKGVTLAVFRDGRRMSVEHVAKSNAIGVEITRILARF